MGIWYVYPQWHIVSFTLIARKHVRELRKYVRITEIDELAFPNIVPHSDPLVILHPFFFIMLRTSKVLEKRLYKYRSIVGIDVADSSRISNLAVSMTHYAQAMIVPSNYCRRVYIESNVKVPIHVVPHGLDRDWYEKPKQTNNPIFKTLGKLKKEKKLIYLLYFLIHSDYRKGADLVMDFYMKLSKERPNVKLVIKTLTEDGPIQSLVRKIGGYVVSGWLSEEQKMSLYDICDIYPLFSRGGGFEVNGLEALGRGLVVIAPRGGSWEDYMPKALLVKSHECPYVLKNNPIHVGKGVEIDVDKALDLAVKVIDNLEKYKEKVRKWKDEVLKKRFEWGVIGKQLLSIIKRYY